jgi:hypothetical protein
MAKAKPVVNIELPYFTLKQLREIFGYKNMNTVWNAVSLGRFPVPTYRLGKIRVADKAIVREYFRQMRAIGAIQLQESIDEETGNGAPM